MGVYINVLYWKAMKTSYSRSFFIKFLDHGFQWETWVKSRYIRECSTRKTTQTLNYYPMKSLNSDNVWIIFVPAKHLFKVTSRINVFQAQMSWLLNLNTCTTVSTSPNLFLISFFYYYSYFIYLLVLVF